MWAAAGAAILRRKVNISEKSLYGIVLLAGRPVDGQGRLLRT